MQSTPIRLSQALWTAFQAAKPTHQQAFLRYAQRPGTGDIARQWSRHAAPPPKASFARLYSDKARLKEVEEKVKDAEDRIGHSFDSRATIAQDAGSTLKSEKEETIVHTLPEASSIVYQTAAPSTARTESHSSFDEPKQGTPNNSSDTSQNRQATWASSQWQNSPLPSQIASLRSRATKRFATFMDNLQSQIVIAAHHINDLTGYTGIERLKKEIEAQEAAVQHARQQVKDSRDRYSEAIAMRSTTQREVNDLLHRKHTWSSADLERFTNLYRSDHANEQAEQKSHQQLSEAETQYEEASTRLAKGILARYHEEQIWSDKIRQMSTWGTWGLMGLNVLLFVIFQIAIEPWRRRRLVRGFEDKVQAALDEKERLTDEKIALIQSQRNGNQIVQDAVQQQPEGLVATAAERVAEAIADAVSGATEDSEQTVAAKPLPGAEEVEMAAERIVQHELESTAQVRNNDQTIGTLAGAEAIDIEITADVLDNTSPKATNVPDIGGHTPNWQTHLASAYGSYSSAFVQQFNRQEYVVLSKRELTARFLEGVAAGVVMSCGIVFVLMRQR